MFARSISPDAVRHVVEEGEIIASYDDDTPHPSILLVGFQENNPLHGLLAYNGKTDTGYVVTTYVPDPAIWSDDFRTRRPQ
jgi:hypothetical protein